MNLRPYIPGLPQVSREVIAVLIATVAAAWIISKIPAVRQLVRDNSLTG